MDPVLGAIGDAGGTARSPLLDPLTVVPIVGDQVDGLRDLTGRLDEIAATADEALVDVESALDATGDAGGKVALTTAALDAVGAIRDELSTGEPVDTTSLVGPLRAAARRFDSRLAEADDDLAELERRMAVARDLLVGPTDVLVVAANNAEIRAGMGMHLSAGVVTIEDGEFDSTEFFATGPLLAVTQGRADTPDELAAMYQRIWDFGREWRTTSTSPNFPVVGSILADLAERSPIGEVDLVLSIDTPALAELLEATGPVTVQGRTIGPDNAVDVLLRDNYLELGDPSQTKERRELQSDVALEIFDALTERDVDAIELAAGLATAAKGRHVLGWAHDDDLQDLFVALGADGALSRRSLLVSFQNASASKRDYYTDTRVRIVPLETGVDGPPRRFRAVATLENPVVQPTAPYVDSLNRFTPVGVHRAFVTFTLPEGVTDIEVVNGDLSSIGTDGPTTVANLWLRVPEGTSGDVAIDFTVPDDLYTFEILPSARIRSTTYEVGPVTVVDEEPTVVPTPWFAASRAQEARPLEAAALVILLAVAVLYVTRSRRLNAPEPDVDGAAADARLARALVLFALALVFLSATT